ncbi:hypothetical protein TraAM80_09112 [Trypanosoma rangeli]|uniref:Uncharacterized protein n=1 Tax=Trypanosoma rangeli TaxID=5698 RepID=A0A3R7M8F5_TRYRA|nr:uncharacterized protein TraAM80_09112 [Trypanosoma rangeli]RNE98046.1 hypothetical protein TraAM80_09112 [Trypanosoma rangeli]|eukprot:RNE98046.1 hypothetical protein TraAM80_09112 [Trypanosoma rangeli]
MCRQWCRCVGWRLCTESDWKVLRAVARNMGEAEIEGQYCSPKPEFVTRMRASWQGDGIGDSVRCGAGGHDTSWRCKWSESLIGDKDADLSGIVIPIPRAIDAAISSIATG